MAPGRYSIRTIPRGHLEVATATIDVAADDLFLTDVILRVNVAGGEDDS